MAKLYVDTDKYGDPPRSAVVEAFHNAVKDLVRRRLDQCGGDWGSFVFGRSYDLIGAAELAEVERKLLASGHRFEWSAVISVTERPEIYKPAMDATPGASGSSFEHPEAVVGAADASGREQRGIGDNIVKRPNDTSGIARYVRSSARVLDWLANGTPADTIALIDDCGGTLTAPILEQFKGVVCAGGTVRSHLAILAREYGIPCLMNAKVRGIEEGQPVEIESSAAARTTEDVFQPGAGGTARIWRLAKRQ